MNAVLHLLTNYSARIHLLRPIASSTQSAARGQVTQMTNTINYGSPRTEFDFGHTRCNTDYTKDNNKHLTYISILFFKNIYL